MTDAVIQGSGLTPLDGGWNVSPSLHRAEKAAPTGSATLGRGRLVQVTFALVLDVEDARSAIETTVLDGLRAAFDLWGEPELVDVGLWTDRPDLMEAALSRVSTRTRPGSDQPL